MAITDIDNMLSAGTSIEVMVYKITAKYGLSKKIVNERVEQLEDLKEIADKKNKGAAK
jgi:predicted transcriptional regulator